jgi:site-specific recombinase XerD
MGSEEDMHPGEKLVTCFRPFVEYLVRSANLSPKTIQRHVDHLWVLGGEIIRDLNETPSLRKKDIAQILVDVIDDEGGPLIYGISSEQQQRSLDSTCRKFHRFLGQSPR